MGQRCDMGMECVGQRWGMGMKERCGAEVGHGDGRVGAWG